MFDPGLLKIPAGKKKTRTDIFYEKIIFSGILSVHFFVSKYRLQEKKRISL